MQDPNRRVALVVIAAFVLVFLLLIGVLVAIESGWINH
jgi:hypothetical protein